LARLLLGLLHRCCTDAAGTAAKMLLGLMHRCCTNADETAAKMLLGLLLGLLHRLVAQTAAGNY